MLSGFPCSLTDFKLGAAYCFMMSPCASIALTSREKFLTNSGEIAFTPGEVFISPKRDKACPFCDCLHILFRMAATDETVDTPQREPSVLAYQCASDASTSMGGGAVALS